MSLTIPNSTKVVLFGAGNFPKDESLASIPSAQSNIEQLSGILAQQNIIGINESNMLRVVDLADNVQILEDVSGIADQAKEALLVYITGHVITRKGHLYLATPHSSRKKIHINGIALDEFMDIISETDAEHKILIFDVIYSDMNDEVVDASIIEDALKYYESAYSNTFIISSSPTATPKNFFAESSGTNFTNALVDVLTNGAEKEQETFSLVDLYKALKHKMPQNTPLKSSANNASDVKFAYNTKFIAFAELKKEADQAFEKQEFQSALKAYKKAGNLFESNQEVIKKKEFIKFLIQGENALSEEKYEKAKDAFEAAQELFDFPIVQTKVNDVSLTIANKLFDKEQYEAAREHYKAVALEMPNNEFVRERLDKCDHELRFLDLIDEADRSYFDDDFEKAHDLYTKALKIHPDRKAAKRKEECERLLNKASKIKQQLAAEQQDQGVELTEDALAQVRKQVEEELRAKIEEEVTAKLSDKIRNELKEEMGKEFTEQMWANVSLANNLEVYDFYLQNYPKAKYADKAKKRFEELSELQEQRAQRVSESIRKSAEQLADQPSKVEEEPKSEEKETPKQEEKPTTQLDSANILEGKQPETSKKDRDDKPETPEDILRMLEERNEEAPKKHKPFVMEEKGEKNVSADKPMEVLDEIEAGFSGKTEQKNGHEVVEEVPLKEERSIIEPKLEAKVEEVKEVPVEEEKKEEVKEEPVVEAPKEEEKTVEEPVAEAPKEEEVKEETKPSVADTASTPLGVTMGEAKAFTEDQLWQKVLAVNTIDSFRFYVDNTKESEHLVDAYYQINKLTKLMDAGELPTVEDTSSTTIEEPVVSTPVTKEEPKEEAPAVSEPAAYTYEAPKVVDSGEDDELWKKATDANTVNAYYEYVANSKAKTYLDEAKNKINELKQNARNSEEDDWKDAEANNTIDGYKKYIKKYPLGHYYAKAMFRISELEAQL